ncbi:expressed unknown protein [Seminavis robusta]|uniref:MYND-type domain-containing protein n=1 Tax=Seminavis robusta TaxID=568900 RepID=A0A9N8DR93_9STRA|nr:expressed unknown protein [Seminavis robusta]|eukprot:Sro313_g114880.1 n/a (588) ;mRNA; r:49853-51721
MPELNEDQKEYLRKSLLRDDSAAAEVLKGSLTWEKNNTITRDLSELAMDKEAHALLTRLQCTRSTVDSSQIIEKLLQMAGTDCERNNSDPYGDGDQSLVETSEGHRQILRQLFANGGDILHWLMEYRQQQRPTKNNSNKKRMSPLAWNCIKGDYRAVEQELKKAKKLMEQRFTSMRLSPLLLAISMSKHAPVIQTCTGTPVHEMKHVEVVRVLLLYGARPNAKDVTGKTACHYGAGGCATKDTLSMCDMCVTATKTCYLVGKKVTLQGLSKEAYNGMQGTLGGFVVDTERRVFHPLEEPTKEMAVKPENVFLAKKNKKKKQNVCITDKSLQATNLVDDRDRIGSISLHEVVISNRDDVALFLLTRSSTCLDVAECAGTSPRKMALQPLMGSQVNQVVRNHIRGEVRKQERKERKKESCGNCGKTARDVGKKDLHLCTKCLDALYCCKECQLSHWKRQHKKDCAKQEQELGLLVGDAAQVPEGVASFNHVTQQGVSLSGLYKPPNGCKRNENFWVKVQSNGIDRNILIYDETRTCHFSLAPGTMGHKELGASVSADPAFMGRKSYFCARFNGEGMFVVFHHTSTVKKW